MSFHKMLAKDERLAPAWSQDWQCIQSKIQDGRPGCQRALPSGGGAFWKKGSSSFAIPIHLKANLEHIIHCTQTANRGTPLNWPVIFQVPSGSLQTLLSGSLPPVSESPCPLRDNARLSTRETHQSRNLPVQSSIQSGQRLQQWLSDIR